MAMFKILVRRHTVSPPRGLVETPVMHTFRRVPLVARLLVTGLTIVLTLSTSARAQDGPRNTAPPLTVTLTMLPSANAAVRGALIMQLGRLSSPRTVEVPAGVSLDTFLRLQCGFYSDKLEISVRAYNPAFGASFETVPRQLALPACPHWDFDKKVAAKRDGVQGALEMMERYMGYSGVVTQRALLDANPSLKGDLSAIRQGMSLSLPYAVDAISFRLREDLRDPRESLRRFIAEFANLVIRKPSGPVEVDLVRDVAPAGAMAADTQCVADQATWPFNRSEVDSVLRDFVMARAPLGPITIVVADTGIARTDVPRLILFDNTEEAGSLEEDGRDNDDDRIKDDRYGANMDPLGGFPLRSDTYDRAAHGISVAGMALGGLRDDALQRDFVTPTLKLAIANVVRSNSTQSEHYITEVALMNSLDLARAFRARVVNWSIESRGVMNQLQQRLQDDQSLIVIAAGNSGQFLDAIGGFPASFVKGRPDTNAIVVGAHGPDKMPLEWSNFGAGTVNLLAPGCRVDTLGTTDRVTVDGTSFAAPLVTFTAALLAAEGVSQPKQIKMRILSTVDLDRRLENWVGSAGRLNIAKALAIHRDVIEMPSDGSGSTPGSMRLGSVTWDTSTLSICDSTVEVRDLVRLAPYYSSDPERPMLAEWMDFDQSGKATYVRQQCPRADASFRFVGIDGTSETLSVGAIADFVAKRR
jgi:subtilase family protein